MYDKLYRSKSDRMIGGVCAGLGAHFNVDPTLVRVAFVIMTFAHGSGLLAYLVLWILVPERPWTAQFQQQHVTAQEAVPVEPEQMRRTKISAASIFGGILIAVGAAALIDELVPWIDVDLFWPLVLVAIGIGLILKPRRASTPNPY
jgi:phage shock protein PspC (stress-responsive transcriptional regulator)